MWKRFDDNIVAELNKINAYINLEILIVLPERNDCCWRWLKLFLIVKGTANARNLKRNLQFHSLQLNGELESYIRKQKKSYAVADDNSVAAGISVHTSGLSESSWLSL